jgi:hypothetical protein
MARSVRQAVVVIHGMGEQLPLSTLTRFIDTALEPEPDGGRVYYSRPRRTQKSAQSTLSPRGTLVGHCSIRRRTVGQRSSSRLPCILSAQWYSKKSVWAWASSSPVTGNRGARNRLDSNEPVTDSGLE